MKCWRYAKSIAADAVNGICAVVERDDAMSMITARSNSMHKEPAPPTGPVTEQIIAIVAEMIDDWGLELDEPIGPDTRLVTDLECGSVDIIHLVVTIEEHFKRPRMGFQELLMKDNRYVDDLTVGQIAAFVSRKLAR
jgi:acyl carrier protein